MRIGIFTDSYRPQVNGVVYVAEILRHNLEALGHEVFIFAPADGLTNKKDPDSHIVRFPAINRFPYKDANMALFFPPQFLKKIDKYKLDIIHCLTPASVGMMGVFASDRLNLPIVHEYCTDLFEYAERYPWTFPGIMAAAIALPFAFKASSDEMKEMLNAWLPKRSIGAWNQEMVKNCLTVLHEHGDAVVVHSRKSAEQLKSWQNGSSYKIDIIPTGVDALPKASKADINAFRKQWNIDNNDEVVLFIGRLAVEKNLDLLVDMMAELIKWRPQAKLIFVGDFDYREELEKKAKASPAADRILFVGRIPREKLGVVQGLAKVFVFPSLTDTQSLTIHEAGQARLPVVMIDEPVTEVVHDGENGYFAQNNPIDFAEKVRMILEDPELQARMGRAGKKYTDEFSELRQTQKLVDIYEQVLAKRRQATS